jgi:prepilin-type N-terminal cleavage/methylation domain-containing protein
MKPAPRGFTLIELLIVVAVIAVVAALAIPSVLRARASANETSAIGSLRTVGSAQASYYASAGNSGYAAALATLARPCPGSTQAYLPADLAGDPSVKSGYRVALQASAGSPAGTPDCNATATATGFYSTAVPLSPGTSGHRSFASGSSGVIFFEIGGAPPTEAVMAAGGRVIQ